MTDNQGRSIRLAELHAALALAAATANANINYIEHRDKAEKLIKEIESWGFRKSGDNDLW